MDEANALFEGDTVRLAFGGPLMTVLALRADRCCCFWFDDEGRLAHGEFEREVIRRIKPAVRLFPHADPFWRRARSNSRPTVRAARSFTSSTGAMRPTMQ